MAINKKLIHFNKKEDFLKEVANDNILSHSIVFIKDSREIYTHEQLYNCSGSSNNDIPEDVNDIIDSLYNTNFNTDFNSDFTI